MKNLIVFAICIFSIQITQASVLKFEKGIAWASFRDLTSSQFSTKFKKYKDDGYLMIDIDAYQTSSGIRYAMVWRKNKDNRGWAEYRDMTSDEYSKRWKEFKEKGYYPLDIESYRVSGKQKYAGIWVQNKEGYAWSSKRNLTAAEYGDYFKKQKDKGYRIIDMEAYSTSSGIRYAAIWVQNKENIAWAQLRDMSRDTYQAEVNKKGNQGYMVMDYETYKVSGKQRYAAIWQKRSGFAYQVRTNLSEKDFANKWREYRDKGYRLVDFERDGSKYGGIWIESSSRFKYSKKKQLNTLISKFRSDNNLPGISVAVIKDGSMIYRRGFGYADKEQKKVAHGESIYLSASISKAIGGTIAAKLQEKRKLANGKSVSLNLNNTTRSYLTNVKKSDGSIVTLPSKHKHTVAQIASHIGCIEHYDGPEPSTKNYKKAIDALTQIWNADFVSGCELGDDYNYSTHAFTYLAAVLEKVSGQSSAKLIRNEIAKPYGLSSMRSLYTSSSIPANYDRVVPYRDNNSPTSFSDNSWKVFGGGIEVSPVDLAWFGWKVLDGKIVSPRTRDNVLWKQVDSDTNHGIAWSLNTVDGKRRAGHSGSWTGTRTRLRVYRDDGVVIAIMANRKVDGLGGLTNDIADIVL